IIQSGATAAVAVAFAQYVIRLGGLSSDLGTPLAISAMLVLSAFHALGIKPGAVLINVITLGKTIAIAALVVGAFVLTRQSGIGFQPLLPEGASGFRLGSIFLAGMVPVMFAYAGSHNPHFPAHGVPPPLRHL